MDAKLYSFFIRKVLANFLFVSVDRKKLKTAAVGTNFAVKFCELGQKFCGKEAAIEGNFLDEEVNVGVNNKIAKITSRNSQLTLNLVEVAVIFLQSNSGAIKS